jgi:hypothetical protein
MRSPGVIYRRYRQLKRKLLYDRVVQARKTCHENCHYGRLLQTSDSDNNTMCLRLCLYGLDTQNLDSSKPEICTNAWECNAFINKWTKEKVVEQFDQEMSSWEVKCDKYPELAAFEWVLDKDLIEAMKNPGPIAKALILLVMVMENILVYMTSRQKNKNNDK